VWRRDDREGEGLLALAMPGLGPDDLTELARLDTTLARLPAEARLAWTLRHVEGWALEEIADGLGVSLATAKRRLSAADEEVARHTRQGREP
jgi:RNA polymerase sigma-70 factor (ECF subfamily)